MTFTPFVLAAGIALTLVLIGIATVISLRNLGAQYRDTVLESATTAFSDLFIFWTADVSWQ